MTVSPWLTFEKLKEFETRVGILETNPNTSIKPVAPNNTVIVDGVTGSDTNDGFTTPIQTLDKVQEILNEYDWNSSNVSVEFSNFTWTQINELYGQNISNTSLIEFCGLGSDVNSAMTFQHFPMVVRITDWNLISGGRISISGCTRVIISNLFATSTDQSTLISVNRCLNLSVDFDTISNPTNLSRILTLNHCFDATFDVNSLVNVTVSTAVIEIFDSVNFFSIGSTGGQSVTGVVLEISEGSSMMSVSGISNITGTLPNVIPDSVRIDGNDYDNTISNLTSSTKSSAIDEIVAGGFVKGIFADDAAAGVGGVQTGEIYQQVGGALFVKQ